jgi:tetratricopeptide (TPR) repeat protein
MRTHYWLLALPTLIVLTTLSLAQQNLPSALVQAQSLSEKGQSRAAIAVLEPLLQPDSHTLDEANRGIAWNLLGSAYSDFEDFNKARHCYENAIRILSTKPDQLSQYATALDRLGSVEESTGHLDESKALRIRARRLFESMGDHAGIAVISGNLAMIALEQHDIPAARQNIAKAFHEMQLATTFQEYDLAVMYTVKGALENVERDFRAGIIAYQNAITLWTHCRGPRYFMLGIAYALLGDTFDRLGEYQQALTNLQHALKLMEDTPGKNTQAYLRVELSYAHALRDAGSKQEASYIEKEAKTALANVRTQLCVGCTISAESFR